MFLVVSIGMDGPCYKCRFLEKQFLCIKVWGVCFADFISISYENEIIWSHFHEIF